MTDMNIVARTSASVIPENYNTISSRDLDESSTHGGDMADILVGLSGDIVEVSSPTQDDFFVHMDEAVIELGPLSVLGSWEMAMSSAAIAGCGFVSGPEWSGVPPGGVLILRGCWMTAARLVVHLQDALQSDSYVGVSAIPSVGPEDSWIRSFLESSLPIGIIDPEYFSSEGTNTSAAAATLLRCLGGGACLMAAVPERWSVPTALSNLSTPEHFFPSPARLIKDALTRMKGRGHVLHASEGLELADWISLHARDLAGGRADAFLGALGIAIRRGTRSLAPGQDAIWIICPRLLSRMAAIAENDITDSHACIIQRDGGPSSFSDVPGLSPQTRERLIGAAARMSYGIGQGLLLCGPPGTGKTMLSAILAKEAGRSFVATSCTRWESVNHLGEHLSNIRRSFDDARRLAPSLLFIDEFDAIGSRLDPSNKNANYVNSVINCLLECLDGVESRGDVAIVAASNFPRAIDPALLRAGRIGDILEIPLPNRLGREEIISFYLSAAIPRLNAGALASRLGDCSPAAIKGLADEAIEMARVMGGKPTMADVERAIQTGVRRLPAYSEMADLLPSIAVGLCGRAAIMSLSWGPDVEIVGLSVLPGLADLCRIDTKYRSGNAPRGTAAHALNRLYVALASSVAVRLVASLAGGASCRFSRSELLARDQFHDDASLFVVAVSVLHALDGTAAVPDPQRVSNLISDARRAVRLTLEPLADAMAEAAWLLSNRGEMAGQEVLDLIFGNRTNVSIH